MTHLKQLHILLNVPHAPNDVLSGDMIVGLDFGLIILQFQSQCRVFFFSQRFDNGVYGLMEPHDTGNGVQISLPSDFMGMFRLVHSYDPRSIDETIIRLLTNAPINDKSSTVSLMFDTIHTKIKLAACLKRMWRYTFRTKHTSSRNTALMVLRGINESMLRRRIMTLALMW